MTELLKGFGDGLNVPSGTPTTWLMPEPEHLRQHLQHLLQLRHVRRRRHQRAAARGNNRSVEEEDKGVYLQADFKMDWGIPVRGNLGVRYVQTDMTSQGYSTTGAPGSPPATTTTTCCPR